MNAMEAYQKMHVIKSQAIKQMERLQARNPEDTKDLVWEDLVNMTNYSNWAAAYASLRLAETLEEIMRRGGFKNG